MRRRATSRQKIIKWAAGKAGPIVGQRKPGAGPPRKDWQPISADLREIPDGEAWLLRAEDGSTKSVLFPVPMHSEELTIAIPGIPGASVRLAVSLPLSAAMRLAG